MDEALHERLRRLAIGRVPLPAGEGPARGAPPPLPAGTEVESEHGAFWLVEKSLDEAAREEEGGRLRFPRRPWRIAGAAGEPIEAPRPIFLDLETTGFTACPLFLAATIDLESRTLRQRFARDYTEERAVVAATAGEIAGAGTLVTFNGRSYDFPFLRNRAAYHRVRIGAAPAHLDLLHHCRRAWKGRFPDFRLQTLERSLGRADRAGDVPGAEIPVLYHAYVRRGFDPRIGTVFSHNVKDVLTLVRLFFLLVEEERERGKGR